MLKIVIDNDMLQNYITVITSESVESVQAAYAVEFGCMPEDIRIVSVVNVEK